MGNCLNDAAVVFGDALSSVDAAVAIEKTAAMRATIKTGTATHAVPVHSRVFKKLLDGWWLSERGSVWRSFSSSDDGPSSRSESEHEASEGLYCCTLSRSPSDVVVFMM